MKTSYDGIVIGSGIVGLSIGYHLAVRGLRILIVDKAGFAAGATGRSSGLIRMHYDLEVEAQLAWASFGYFRNWTDRVGGECGFVRTGFLYIDAPRNGELIRANVDIHRRLGIPTSVVSADDVQRMYPTLRTDDFEVAAYEPESGYADPALAAGGFLDALRRLGGDYAGDCAVTALTTTGSRMTGVSTNRGDYSAPIIVNAAGAWAAGIAMLAGVDIPLTTWTHDVAHVRRPHETGPLPTVIDGALSMYFRPDSGALVLVALEDHNRTGENPDAPSQYVAGDFVERVIDRLCQRVPSMSAGTLQSTHVGRDGITPDQHAILGAAGPDGLYHAVGFSGTGFKTAPAVGLCMTELIVDGHAATVDISSFSPDRFRRGELLRGRHAYGNIWK